ncbi:MAG: tRNA threonylcarbamoyladenosine dehydratase, partial [Prevotella sp.]|nr:tRNA threonylcarbamoyladenosine dehydratase [Prevotella sp.]
EETPMKPYKIEDLSTINNTPADGNTTAGKRQTPASNAFVPAAAGLVIAAEVVKDLCKI